MKIVILFADCWTVLESRPYFSPSAWGATNSECHRPVKLFCTQIVLFTINLSQNEIKYHSRFVCSSSDTGSEV